MAQATLTGVTKLKNTEFQKGLQELRKGLQDFRKEVAAPFSEAAESLAELSRNAALVAVGVAGIGTKAAWDDERGVTRFRMLGMAMDEAAKHYEHLVKMGLDGNSSAFFPEQWIETATAMNRLGGAALDNKDFLTLLGDAAAKSGKPLQELGAQFASIYAKMAAGKSIEKVGIELVASGLISSEDLKNIDDAIKDGKPLAETWSMVTVALERARGSMALLSSTGFSQLGRLRSIIGEGMSDVFKGFAERVKDVVYQISENLLKLYNDGTFSKWGDAIAGKTSEVLSVIWRIVQAWQTLNQNSRAQLENMMIVFASFIVAWKSGFLKPMIEGIVGLSAFVIKNFGLVAAAISALLIAITGFKVGEAIYNALSPAGQGRLQKFAAALMGFAEVLGSVCSTMYKMAVDFGSNLWLAMWGKQTNFSGDFKDRLQEYGKSVDSVLDKYNGVSKMIDQEVAASGDQSGATFGQRFQSELEKQFKDFNPLTALEDWIKSLMPQSLKDMLEQFKETSGITFPKMPEVTPLPEQLQTEKAISDMEKLNKSHEVLRGIYARFPSLKLATSPQTAVNNARSPQPTDADQQRIQQAVKTTELMTKNNQLLAGVSDGIKEMTSKLGKLQSIWV